MIKYLYNVRSSSHVLLPDLIIFIRSLTSMAVIWKSLTILNTYKALINETNSQILNSLACFASTILLNFSSHFFLLALYGREVKKVNYCSWDLTFSLIFTQCGLYSTLIDDYCHVGFFFTWAYLIWRMLLF